MQRSVVTPKRPAFAHSTSGSPFSGPSSASPSQTSSHSPLSSARVQLEAPPSSFVSPHRLSFYDNPPPPSSELPLECFEEWALDRMTVLDELDRLMNKPKADKEREMRAVLNKQLPLTRGSATSLTQKERFKDAMSHFILRLAFCQKQEDRNRFLKLETALFRLRFELTTLEESQQFIASLKFQWPLASPEELANLEPLLRFANPHQHTPLEPHFKVKMEEVTDLVRQRKVVLRAGIAYVPQSLQVSMLTKEFHSKLSEQLEKLAKYRLRFQNDPRIEPVLQLANSGFSKHQYQPDSSKLTEKVDVRMLDSMDKQNYLPLCASMLQHSLKKNRHPLHAERLQHQRFLLNIGMPSDEVIALYRMYYDDAKKLKQIEYSIEHMAGLRGNRKKIGPSSCTTIYKEGLSAPSNQVHGCPFQRLSADKLVMLLKEHGVTDEEGIDEVKRHAETKQIHLACSKTYELTHPADKTKYEHTISSPVQYFQRAVEFSKSKGTTAAATS